MSSTNGTWQQTFPSRLTGEDTEGNAGWRLLNGSLFGVIDRWPHLNGSSLGRDGSVFNANCSQNAPESLNFTVFDDICDVRRDISLNTALMLATRVVFALFVINAFTATCTNVSVLYALCRVNSSRLNAKLLIQNATVANLLLPLVSCVDMPTLMGNDVSAGLRMCIGGIYFLAFSIASFVQTLSIFGLSLDRVYAIATPLRYGTVGYSRWQNALLVTLPWFSAAVIWACSLARSLQLLPPPPNDVPGVCFVLMSTFDMMWKIRLVDAFFLSFHLVSFIIYMVVFICFKCHQNSVQNISDTHVKQSTLSLAVAYFLVNLTTLCLYLPVPIYSLLHQHMMNDPIELGQFVLTMKSLQCLYFFSSTLHPILLVIRIRSIRENLPLKCRWNVS